MTAADPHADLAHTLMAQLAPGDAAHDGGHLRRVWANARRISAGMDVDPRLLRAAVILHDGVAVPKDSPDRPRASRLSADRAAAILADLSWSQNDIDAVHHAIVAHSFSANVEPRTHLARVVQDADRLDALGLIGVARCFAVSGSLGRALYDPDDPGAVHRPLDDSAFALDHFQTKLLRLSGGFTTPVGKTMAAARHARLREFYDDLLAEIA